MWDRSFNFQAMLSSLIMAVIKFTKLYFSLGIGSKYKWIWGGIVPVWMWGRAHSRKGKPCLKEMWFLIDSEKKELCSLFYQLRALVKCTGVWVYLFTPLKSSAPQNYCLYIQSLQKFQNGIWPQWKYQVCAHFIMWSSGTWGMMHAIPNVHAIVPSHITG